MEISKTNEVNQLFDFYGDLLTPKQREYIEMYYRDDYSLGEIAEYSQVSRQAVYDNIRRTEKILKHYEKILHLKKYYQLRNERGEELFRYFDTQYPTDTYLKKALTELLLIEDSKD